ncbi:hypothetical protein VOLCADRAFT_100124 [Volvox carteri f. nagariensis]|uniref:Protein kinase domain-containing protein n=1 Tax=Volvox carteri f. nagariensis TaxID=3068 RepID=D8UJG9_VOLCA|nr:uncharacterized protein VOLCADRAFT_100124 [Volvox carteri f. nagariensis]EFJ40119.1 hypothetical protein VOLCADRAFT_100124 [Volvox carteri f. nagariensis]|eukprot:XP_002958815.1 hypothetical protein VOLCADRAFT_100124 [Volvox carteri f. nagariensis]
MGDPKTHECPSTGRMLCASVYRAGKTPYERFLRPQRLSQQQLKRLSSFPVLAIVRSAKPLPGTWHGTTVAVKILVTPALNLVALRETHLGPQLQHPHIVQTYATRCARLTNEYFDHMETHMDQHSESFDVHLLGPITMSRSAAGGAPGGGRQLRPVSTTETSGIGVGAAVGNWVTLVIMEFCDMKTLHIAIAKGLFLANLSWSQRVANRALLRTAAEIARGLHHLHSAGVVHGDLKPTNILLRSGLSDRRGFIAKVADFGAAHVLPAEARSTNTTTWGTVPYMAPEHLSAGRISRATDVYSFGVVLWEMLTQQMPYSGMQPGQVAHGISHGTLELSWPTGLPAPMDEVVALGQRCTSRDPARRPSSSDIMLELVRLEGQLRMNLSNNRNNNNNDDSTSNSNSNNNNINNHDNYNQNQNQNPNNNNNVNVNTGR